MGCFAKKPLSVFWQIFLLMHEHFDLDLYKRDFFHVMVLSLLASNLYSIFFGCFHASFRLTE